MSFKFINLFEQLQEGWLYEARDAESEFGFTYEILRITEHEFYIRVIDDIEPNQIGTLHSFSPMSMSAVPETNSDFDSRNQWAYYEIGLKEECPEYFL